MIHLFWAHSTKLFIGFSLFLLCHVKPVRQGREQESRGRSEPRGEAQQQSKFYPVFVCVLHSAALSVWWGAAPLSCALSSTGCIHKHSSATSYSSSSSFGCCRTATFQSTKLFNMFGHYRRDFKQSWRADVTSILTRPTSQRSQEVQQVRYFWSQAQLSCGNFWNPCRRSVRSPILRPLLGLC